MPDAILGCVHRSIACKTCKTILASCVTWSRLYLEYGITCSLFGVKNVETNQSQFRRN